MYINPYSGDHRDFLHWLLIQAKQVRMTGIVAMILLVVSGIATAGNREYYCRFGGDHTMCLYKGVGLQCFPRLRGGVGAADRAAILEKLNEHRQRVAEGREGRGSPGPQPPAANMRRMEWSLELAMIAQRWADQCIFDHDSCRSVADFLRVGQVVYQQSSVANGTLPPAEWCHVISAWFDQAREFNRASIYPFVAGGRSADYTQLAWGESHRVGCGFTVYRTEEDRSCTLRLYVCNLGPGGNVPGAAVYAGGGSCSACPRGTACRPPAALCQ